MYLNGPKTPVAVQVGEGTDKTSLYVPPEFPVETTEHVTPPAVYPPPVGRSYDPGVMVVSVAAFTELVNAMAY